MSCLLSSRLCNSTLLRFDGDFLSAPMFTRRPSFGQAEIDNDKGFCTRVHGHAHSGWYQELPTPERQVLCRPGSLEGLHCPGKAPPGGWTLGIRQSLEGLLHV